MSRIAKYVAVALIAMLVALLIVKIANSASTRTSAVTVRGQVSCATDPNVGIWVETGSESAGWAKRTMRTPQSYDWSYKLSPPTSYQVHVGCGGTQMKWVLNIKSDNVVGNNNFTCYDRPEHGAKYLTCEAQPA